MNGKAFIAGTGCPDREGFTVYFLNDSVDIAAIRGSILF